LASISKWSVRWIGVKLKKIRQTPSLIVTDGLASYNHLTGKVKRVLCLFHHQQGVTRWLKEHFPDKDRRDKRKKDMKKVFQTNDKRTVKRRLKKLKQRAKALEIEEWVKKTEICPLCCHRLEVHESQKPITQSNVFSVLSTASIKREMDFSLF